MKLSTMAVAVLETSDAVGKVAATQAMAMAWRSGRVTAIGNAKPPALPSRPARPELANAKDMPQRKLGSVDGRSAFIHAIAHIELNAIDLACDMIARFSAHAWPPAFFDDWVSIADDEARHFSWLNHRLEQLGKCYGDYPAHNGLWDAADASSDDPLVRLAVVPMVLEARGLDTTPGAVQRLISVGDRESADILAQIGVEEEPHVAAGVRWFEHLCAERALEPIPTFHRLIKERLKVVFKPPFATQARQASGMDPAYYMPLVKTTTVA